MASLSSKLSHLCGTSYTNGNIIYTPDGNSLISPNGNRISVFDLITHNVYTMPFENPNKITVIAISPDSRLLLSIDESGHGLISNFNRRIVLHRLHFRNKTRAAMFSPDGRYIAVTVAREILLYKTPEFWRQLGCFPIHRVIYGFLDDITSLQWSSCSKYLLCGSKDTEVRIFGIRSRKSPVQFTLLGHKDRVIGAFFADNLISSIYTIARDGVCLHWTLDDGTTEKLNAHPEQLIVDGEWKVKDRHFFHKSTTKIACVSYHAENSLLVLGFANGIFGLYEMPGCVNVHTLSISNAKIQTCAINKTGEWLAFGSPFYGQLLVWEWQSETYILKQQGHNYGISCFAYSPDGHTLASGAEDCKLKLWSTTNGFCYVTFTEHTAPITGVAFVGNGSAVVSSSLDGTVRAFDMIRYTNFRTMTTPTPVQFASLALDPSGEIVCAGAMDPFEIYVWSLQTGKLLDIFSGHQGPIISLSFSPSKGVLASASWDGTVKLWNVYKNEIAETLEHGSDVLAVAFHPNGNELCSSCLNGNLYIWDTEMKEIKLTIDGRRDISGGRKSTDRVSAQNNASSKYFTTVAYTGNGTCILAGGKSKYVCVYETTEGILVKKYQISYNRSLEGVLDELDSRKIVDGVNLAALDISDNENDPFEDEFRRPTGKLPGAKKGKQGARNLKPEVLSNCVRASPSGVEWAVACQDGILIFSSNQDYYFDPVGLDEEITPSAIQKAIDERHWTRAMIYSLHLNRNELLRMSLEIVPIDEISLVAQSVPRPFIPRLLQVLAERLQNSPHIEFFLQWCLAILQFHGTQLMKCSSQEMISLRQVFKSITLHQKNIQKVCTENKFTLDFITFQESLKPKP